MRDWKAFLQKVRISASRKWRRLSFAFAAASGLAVDRLSANRFGARILSILGLSTKSRTVRGESVAVVALDERRRAFLKYAAFGGAVLLAGKYVTPLVNTLRGDAVLSEKTFDNFKVTETGKQLKVTDDDGAELLIIDKESF